MREMAAYGDAPRAVLPRVLADVVADYSVDRRAYAAYLHPHWWTFGHYYGMVGCWIMYRRDAGTEVIEIGSMASDVICIDSRIVRIDKHTFWDWLCGEKLSELDTTIDRANIHPTIDHHALIRSHILARAAGLVRHLPNANPAPHLNV